MAVDVYFSAYMVIVGEEFAEKSDFDVLLPFNGVIEKYNDASHLIEVERLNDEFYWIYSEYGKTLPYVNKVYDEYNKRQEDNPRKSYHAELNKQIFCLYDVKDRVLYVSNNKKKNFVVSFLKEKLAKDVSLKSICNDIEDFLSVVKYITRVELVRRRNLMTLDADVFTASGDAFGLGTPSDARLEVNFQPAKITERFKAALRTMKAKKQGGEIDTFVCVGKDDANFEAIFNLDSLQYKTDLKCSKDDNGMIDKEEVKRMIFKKVSLK